MSERTDVLIVGGGAAGCAVAHRVSANPDLRVTLVEAGVDAPPDHTNDILWDSFPGHAYFEPRHHWTDLRVRLQATPPAGAPDTRELRRYEQGKVMGGGSSINGMMANRGGATDYDAWHAMGATGWDWAGVLPYFRRIEHDHDFPDHPEHGNAGPIPVRRVPLAEWPGFNRQLGVALGNAGFPYLADQNAGPFTKAWFSMAINNVDDRRASAAWRYLDAATRARPNLTILARTRVLCLIVEAGAVVGVEVAGPDGARRRIDAAEVVVSAGAIHTPALLLQAGIGPGADLQAIGTPLVRDLPGVGANLQEHPQIAINAYLPPHLRLPETQRRHIFAGFRYSSGVEGCSETDMYGVGVNRGAWHPLGRKLGGLLIWINKAYSQGRVSLASPAPGAEPAVDFNLLADPRDAERLVGAVQLAARLYADPALREVEFPYITNYSEASRDLAVATEANAAKVQPTADKLDDPAFDRGTVMREEVAAGNMLADMIADPARLDAFVRHRVVGTWHCSCTARMGREDDPLAVCDPAGRVYGVRGLRVADTSLMPAITCANTHFPALMIGEKISDAILADHR
jgi:5-(hydroxymethyl)furfural/furfural oxidase